jgi:hypothetical protein
LHLRQRSHRLRAICESYWLSGSAPEFFGLVNFVFQSSDALFQQLERVGADSLVPHNYCSPQSGHQVIAFS